MERKLKLLLADDDDAFAMLVDRIMQRDALSERCAMHRVNDGTEAVSYLAGDGDYADRIRFPMPDVVVLDQRMTRMDGSEALVEIKKDEHARSIPVCIFSTSAQKKLQDLCYDRSATFCMQKPLEFEALEQKIKLMVDFFSGVMELPQG